MQQFVVPSSARSWVPGADASDFPIQNMPYCVAIDEEREEHAFVRMGDYLFHLDSLAKADLLPDVFFQGLTSFFVNESAERAEVREALYELFRADNGKLRDNQALLSTVMRPLSVTSFEVPVMLSQFVDYYSGIHHASNVGKMFRPDQPPLLPNYRHVPVAYNGRANTVVVSGTPIVRPNGQTKGPQDELPTWGPTRELDFELELGFFGASGNEMGDPIAIEDAGEYIAGVVLLNDWSARDMQRWEYQPLGPFLAKSFATTISPYVVPLDALEPFRVPGVVQDPLPLRYLAEDEDRVYDLQLEVLLYTAGMSKPQVISRSNAKHLYWSFRQQLVHQASNGTPVGVGELYGTGTISGPEPGSEGSMLELTWRGTKPITLEELGVERTFLEDGDTVILRGYAEGDGFRIGLGECAGTIVPALDYP